MVTCSMNSLSASKWQIDKVLSAANPAVACQFACQHSFDVGGMPQCKHQTLRVAGTNTSIGSMPADDER